MAKRIPPAALGALLLAGLLLPVSSPAKLKPISGKLSKPGYTVIALAANGAAKTDLAPKGKFKLRPPAKKVTLQLRRPDGVYGGPVVISKQKKGKRLLLGVKAGAKLGKVNIKGGRGYAKLKKRLAKRWLDAKRTATAKKGVPIGAGNFGRVRVKKLKGPSADRDLDGIPAPLDVDDDGDLVLDNIDAPSVAHASQAGGPPPFTLLTGLDMPLVETANANAPGSTDQQIEAALPRWGRLLVEIRPGESAELDCGALVYCSLGGTGKVFEPGVPPSNWPPFPACCDPDADSFGSLSGSAPPGGSTPFMSLMHGATTAQIGTGDVLIERVLSGGVESQFPSALEYVFSTVPALVSYSDTAGNSATVPYPVPRPSPDPFDPGGPGVPENGFPVGEGPDGNIALTLTLWRPQRRPIPPETSDWIDIGGLTYTATIGHLGPVPGGTTVGKPCPQGAYSSPELTPTSFPVGLGAGGLADPAPDRAASPLNTVTFTLNLTQCLASLGFTWSPNEEMDMGLTATPRSPNGAGQIVTFVRQP